MTLESSVAASGEQDNAVVRLCAVVAGVFVAYIFVYLVDLAARQHPYSGSEFMAIWSYARIMLSHPAALLYDPHWLHMRQLALGMSPQAQAPFPYPPTFLLYIAPLGTLNFFAAYALWVLATFSLYLLTTCKGQSSPGPAALALLLAPTTIITATSGQSGFLLAALLVGGLRLMDRRPMFAGVLFGLLTYKAQFGLMIPVTLLAARRWRCILSACATTVVLAAVAIRVFGASIWPVWWNSLPQYSAWFHVYMTNNVLRPTVDANLELLGFGQAPRALVQAVASLAAAAIVIYASRRLPRAQAIPVILAATCLATPHAFVYDFPVLSAAVVLFALYRIDALAPLALGEVAVLLAALAFPLVMSIGKIHLPMSTVSIALLLLVMLKHRSSEAAPRSADARMVPADA